MPKATGRAVRESPMSATSFLGQNFMRLVPWSIVAATWLWLGSSSMVAAQTPPDAGRLFAAAGDVTTLIERARRERKMDQPLYVLPIVQLSPYNANLEYRVGGNATANFH